MIEAWYASACAIIAAQNAGRPFTYYDQSLPHGQRRPRRTP